MCGAPDVSACMCARSLSAVDVRMWRTFDECVLPVMAGKGREKGGGGRRPRRDASDQGTTHVYPDATSAHTHTNSTESRVGDCPLPTPSTAALSIEVRRVFINNKVLGVFMQRGENHALASLKAL